MQSTRSVRRPRALASATLLLAACALVAPGCGEAMMTDPDASTMNDAANGDAAGGGDTGGGGSDAGGGGDGGTGYTEPVPCATLAPLTDLASAYTNTAAGLRAAAQGIADRRYPIGRVFVDYQNDMQLGTWFRTRNTFNDVLFSFEVAVHEGQHIWDITMAGATWPYRLREDLVIRTRRLTNFNRSEILSQHVDVASDQYAPVYLMGMSGAQGFNTLLDEYSAYVHSLAARYCTRDGLGAGQRISARDGILTMMYYVEVYLRIARTQHPDDYAEILGDPEHVRMILTTWDRAEFYLGLTEGMPQLGLRDATIRGWTYDPMNLSEIQRLRAM